MHLVSNGMPSRQSALEVEDMFRAGPFIFGRLGAWRSARKSASRQENN
jgi:hypothetical protein